MNEAAGGDLRVALVMSKTGRGGEEARRALESTGWVVERAVAELSGGVEPPSENMPSF